MHMTLYLNRIVLNAYFTVSRFIVHSRLRHLLRVIAALK